MSTMFISKETARIVGFTPEEIKLADEGDGKLISDSMTTTIDFILTKSKI